MAKPWDDIPYLEQELADERRRFASRQRAEAEGRVADRDLFTASMSRQWQRIAMIEAGIDRLTAQREAELELAESHDPTYGDAA